jgi:hypothetical protein
VRTIEQPEWLAMLEAELARRSARVQWESDAAERAAQWLIETLQEIARRFAVLAPMWPLQINDMSTAELLACRLFLPEHLRPPNLPTEAKIWDEYERRRETAEAR